MGHDDRLPLALCRRDPGPCHRRGAKTATYLLLRYFVDSVLGKERQPRVLALIALGFIGLALVEGGFTFLSGRFAAQTAEGVARRLRNYLYDHIQRLTFSYHDRMETGELIQRSTSDVDAMRRFYAEQAIGIGRIILLFGINFFVISRLNLQLALLSVIVVPVIVVISYFFFKRISRAYEKYQEQEASLSTVLQENLSGVRVVKAFARQAYERDKFERENWREVQAGPHAGARALALLARLRHPVRRADAVRLHAGRAHGDQRRRSRSAPTWPTRGCSSGSSSRCATWAA